jgi:hypothetical protein
MTQLKRNRSGDSENIANIRETVIAAMTAIERLTPPALLAVSGVLLLLFSGVVVWTQTLADNILMKAIVVFVATGICLLSSGTFWKYRLARLSEPINLPDRPAPGRGLGESETLTWQTPELGERPEFEEMDDSY